MRVALGMQLLMQSPLLPSHSKGAGSAAVSFDFPGQTQQLQIQRKWPDEQICNPSFDHLTKEERKPVEISMQVLVIR